MQVSLLSRFQGTLLGAILGEMLGAYCQAQLVQNQPISWPDVACWRLATLTASPWQLDWGDLIIEQTRSLIEHRGLDLTPIGRLKNSHLRHNLKSTISSHDHEGDAAAGMAIATLPLAMFLHADPSKFQRALKQVLPPESALSAFMDALVTALVYGQAIALALYGQLNPANLVTDIVASLASMDTPLTDPQFEQSVQHRVQALTSVRTLTLQSKGIETVTQQLLADPTLRHPMALALYGFLSTPADFNLTVVRAARLGYQPQLTCTLAGALAGAYTGISGLPISSRLAVSQVKSMALSSLRGANPEVELLQLAHQLFALWSGADNPTNFPPCNHPTPVVSVARSII
ncbi:MAG: ADP-ribosylglycohydrolase family protein [Cyanothece sp. SIO1E1]|nr:ADP-ribosylglycohydrolase family protein [Cyanothece sp. SIO1E1]